MATMGNQIFSTGQVAKMLNVAPRTVSKWVDHGHLPGYRLPGSNDRRVMLDALVTFCQAHGMPVEAVLGLHSFRVLLVGVDGVTAGRLRGLLLGDSYQFTAAADSFEAGSQAAACRPQAAVLDAALGRGEVLRIAAHLRAGYARRLVLVLAGEDEGDAGEFTAAGCDAVYRRPFDAALLAERLRARAEGERVLSGKRGYGRNGCGKARA